MQIKSPKMLFFGIILSDCITFGTVKQPLKKFLLSNCNILEINHQKGAMQSGVIVLKLFYFWG
mgnify:CR=1 FL=1